MNNNDKEIKIFCENIKYLRKEQGLSKKEMAKKLGISTASLSILESGKLPPRLTVEPLFHIHKNFFGMSRYYTLKCSIYMKIRQINPPYRLFLG